MKKPNGERPLHSAAESGHLPASTPTVLHVDDDANDAELLQAAARRISARFNLQSVYGGEEAIAYLSGSGAYSDRKRYPLPVLILLDLKMPRANGFEVLAWVRQQPQLSTLPVVVLSGSELEADMRRASAAGANSYLVKPLGFESLVRLMAKVAKDWLPAPPPAIAGGC
jgi:CheY-like chemotaxis protein